MLGGNEAAAASAVQNGQALALGALLTRYLVEAPPNVCTPSYLADTAAKIAAAAPEVMKLEVSSVVPGAVWPHTVCHCVSLYVTH
jgi:leucyl aminopeptidase